MAILLDDEPIEPNKARAHGIGPGTGPGDGATNGGAALQAAGHQKPRGAKNGKASKEYKDGGRLKPTQHTLRRLYLTSGNLCAFPECNRIMLNAHGTFVGQVAHIEAAEEGGPRYNVAMTDEDRRHISNLMLMCYEHHREVDLNVGKFDPDTLRFYKKTHERQFSQGGRLISVALRDRTKAEDITYPKTLARLEQVLDWKMTDDQRQSRIAELTDYIEHFRKTPFELRRFFGAVVERWRTMRRSGVVEKDAIQVSDICHAFDLTTEDVWENVWSLDDYGIAGPWEMWHFNPWRMRHGIKIFRTGNGWPIWEDLANFAWRELIPLHAFAEDLDFARLDG